VVVIKGFRFFFTSHDRGEDPHVHALWKSLLKDLSVEYSPGTNLHPKERKILEIVEENQNYFLKEWKRFFKEK